VRCETEPQTSKGKKAKVQLRNGYSPRIELAKLVQLPKPSRNKPTSKLVVQAREPHAAGLATTSSWRLN
jgi:hypothetical protein